jgi:hypothetical protein
MPFIATKIAIGAAAIAAASGAGVMQYQHTYRIVPATPAAHAAPVADPAGANGMAPQSWSDEWYSAHRAIPDRHSSDEPIPTF